MSEYIRTNKIDPNECPNKYLCPIYSNILIFKYIRHTLVQSVRVVDNFVQSDTFKVALLPHCTLDWILEPSYVQNSKHIFSKLGGEKNNNATNFTVP